MSKLRVKNFEKLSLGLFIHYGVYSSLERGEWAKAATGENDDVYDSYIKKFHPKNNWAENIVNLASKNGFKYIVLTTRHHDGFSLYDTCGLSDFDTTKILPGNRDLVKEFVYACKKYNCKPFFYHTLIDWREEKRFNSFDEYLKYLRKSIDILCSNYGEIGGFWFDGQWKYPNANWHLDELYGIIRQKQPDAVIINNSGLNALGEKTHEEIDAVTFERATINKFDRSLADGNYSVEMCQTMNSHWGYAKNDITYKSVCELLKDFLLCRCYGGNFLLNIGPMSNGSIRPIEKNIIKLLGQWFKQNTEWIYLATPLDNHVNEGYFILQSNKAYYVIFLDVPMQIDPNVQRYQNAHHYAKLPFLGKIKSAIWLDDRSNVELKFENNFINIVPKPFDYGTSLYARVAKIIVK